MDSSNKVKSLSKKIAASLIKNKTSGDLERSEIFDTKTKTQILVFINKNLENEKFIGSFNKSLPIEDILLSIKNTNSINTYEINNKTISIK